MTTLPYPREWASDALYSAGSASGTTTKTDPGAALTAQGIVPGRASAQHVNHLLHSLSVAARHAAPNWLRSWGVLTPDSSLPSLSGLAAVYRSDQHRWWLSVGSTNGSMYAGDDTRADTHTNTGTVSAVRDAAYNPTGGVLVCVGTGGGFIARSTDFGNAWADASAGDIVSRTTVIWAPGPGQFVAQGAISSQRISPDGDTWTLSGHPNMASNTAPGQIATNSAGYVLDACDGPSNGPKFLRTVSPTSFTSGWTDAVGNVPNNTDCIEVGSVAALGTKFFHAAAIGAGNQIRVHVSTDDATSWGLLSTVTLATGTVAANATRIVADAYSGALLLIADVSGSAELWLSLDQGVSWIGPARLYVTGGPAHIRFAGGRIWSVQNGVMRRTTGQLPAA